MFQGGPHSHRAVRVMPTHPNWAAKGTQTFRVLVVTVNSVRSLDIPPHLFTHPSPRHLVQASTVVAQVFAVGADGAQLFEALREGRHGQQHDWYAEPLHGRALHDGRAHLQHLRAKHRRRRGHLPRASLHPQHPLGRRPVPLSVVRYGKWAQRSIHLT